jgi:hypothetical protein
MAKYITVAPNGVQVTVSHSYGSKTFAHGEIIYNDNIAVLFPSLFHQLPEDVTDVIVEPVVDAVNFVQDVIEAVKEEVVTVTENVKEFVEDVKDELLPTPELPKKKKAGRPAGAKNKKPVKKPTKKKE